MSRYLARLKAFKSEKPSPEVLPKPTQPPFGSFGSKPDRRFETKTEEAMPEYIWKNPYLQGTPEARVESLRIIRAAQRGEPI
jgi:hypothetical protein